MISVESPQSTPESVLTTNDSNEQESPAEAEDNSPTKVSPASSPEARLPQNPRDESPRQNLPDPSCRPGEESPTLVTLDSQWSHHWHSQRSVTTRVTQKTNAQIKPKHHSLQSKDFQIHMNFKFKYKLFCNMSLLQLTYIS